eukprot:NP_510345.2 Uncharacterized protein CELE_F16B12.1 [Caenorhabditis elegans]
MDYEIKKGNCTCEEEVYEATIEHGIIKSPHYPNSQSCDGRCVYIILPHPNKTVSLYTSSFEISSRASLIVYSLLEENGERIRIPHAKIRRPENYFYSFSEMSFPSFVSAKNAGFEVHFISHRMTHFTSFKISFDRNYEYDEVCGYPIVDIGMDETLVQLDHAFRAASGCVFMLRPKYPDLDEEDEMVINIGYSIETIASIRTRDENGKLTFGQLTSGPRSVVTSAHFVQIISHKTERTNGLYKMEKITAKIIKRGCDCGAGEFLIGNNNQTSVSIHSPGWPDLYCPQRNCKYSIKPFNSGVDNDKMAIFEVHVKAIIGTAYKEVAEHYDTTFVVKQQTLLISYQSEDKYYRRFFEVNVTQKMIDPDCSCNFFNDKTFSSEGKMLNLSFPAHCAYIYCHFQFKDSRSYSPGSVLDFQLKGAVEGDKVIIKDARHEETYQSTQLNRMNRYDVFKESEFTFYRKHLPSEGNVEVFVNWTLTKSGGSCLSLMKLSVDVDKPLIIISPRYPSEYANNEKCKFLILAPDHCRLTLSIDEISLENFHDFVFIYDGNSTDGKLIKRYTSHITHEVLNISSSSVLIMFQTDQSISDRGFHITATAHYLRDLYDGDNSLTYALIALALVFIIAILLVIYVYEKYLAKDAPRIAIAHGAGGGDNFE